MSSNNSLANSYSRLRSVTEKLNLWELLQKVVLNAVAQNY